MSEQMIFLGCDGGSTKTDFILVNQDGDVLSRVTKEGCNFCYIGEEGFKSLMTLSIQELLHKAKVSSEDVTSAMFGVTVYGEVEGTEELMPGVIHEQLPHTKIMVENDSVAGWGGSLGGHPGINVVSGTGSIVYGRDEDRNGTRVGGYSLFFADEGSCTWIGRQVAAEFIRQVDGRSKRTGLYTALREALNLSKDIYFASFLQNDARNDSSLMATLQPIAMQQALLGDEVCISFYERAAAELTQMAVAVKNTLNFKTSPIRASYSGGLFKTGDLILNPFRECMKKEGFDLVTPKYGPLVGAVALACDGFLPPDAMDKMLEKLNKSIF